MFDINLINQPGIQKNGDNNDVSTDSSSKNKDNNTVVDHKKTHCTSSELYKGMIDESATGVFNGKVSRIFVVKGNGKAILINHGNYYTVYSGLKDVLVKNGEQVVRKQKLGTIITKDGDTELHFEIWKGTTTENPVKWLYQSY